MKKNANDYLDRFLTWLSENWKFLLVAYVAWLFARKKVVESGTSSVVFVRPVNEDRATISDAKAKELAEALFKAFEEFMSTDDDAVERVYQILNHNVENLKKVYNAFGVKKYGFVGSSWGDWYGIDLSLFGWIKAELRGDAEKKWLVFFSRAGIET